MLVLTSKRTRGCLGARSTLDVRASVLCGLQRPIPVECTPTYQGTGILGIPTITCIRFASVYHCYKPVTLAAASAATIHSVERGAGSVIVNSCHRPSPHRRCAPEDSAHSSSLPVHNRYKSRITQTQFIVPVFFGSSGPPCSPPSPPPAPLYLPHVSS